MLFMFSPYVSRRVDGRLKITKLKREKGFYLKVAKEPKSFTLITGGPHIFIEFMSRGRNFSPLFNICEMIYHVDFFFFFINLKGSYVSKSDQIKWTEFGPTTLRTNM